MTKLKRKINSTTELKEETIKIIKIKILKIIN